MGVRILVAAGLLAGGGALAASNAIAGPATYYASPAGTDSDSCPQSAPCTLQHAVSRAASGDVVIVEPGTYSLSNSVQVTGSITVEGQPGQPRPSLVGSTSLNGPTVQVSGKAVISHLQIEAQDSSGSGVPALSLTGGTGEDLILTAASTDSGGDALSVAPSLAGTIVRTVLAVDNAPNGAGVYFASATTDDAGDSGDTSSSTKTVTAYNVTAIGAGSGSVALSGDVRYGTVTIKNSIASGQGADISIASGTNSLNLTYSDFRPSHSSGYVDKGGNLLAPPVFVNPSAGNYHEAGTSPTVDAGATDSALTATDLDGNPRVLGSAPDMGAYEYVGDGTASPGLPDDVSTQLPPATGPVPGVSVALHRVFGLVRIELPQHRRFIRLRRAAEVPVGSVIDVTQGSVILTSAVNRHGGNKSGDFRAGRFVLTQSTGPHPKTDMRLVGGTFAGCSPVGASADDPVAGITRRRPRRRVVRQLWGSDNGGSFVTIGNTASAAVRGTVWLTQDTCDGTVVNVVRGAVLVHDDVSGRNLLIHQGQSYLARARR